MLMGKAGTGKSYTILQRCAADESYGLICSTTGVSAVNLGATTINSALGYFDTDSLKDGYLKGSIIRRLHSLAKDYRRLIIDEMSMMEAEQLTYIYRGVRDANDYRDIEEPLGILLTGDLLQLPPINASWIFESPYWPQFEANQETLTKNWRQHDPKFAEAMNAVRRGDGALGAELLESCGCQWHSMRHIGFDGTTILPDNASVSRHNEAALDGVQGEDISNLLVNRRWGKQRSEWSQSPRTREWGIPPTIQMKISAYVMILSNQSDGEGGFLYVNGDCGHVLAFDVPPQAEPFFCIQLVRGGEVYVHRVVRNVETEDKPQGFSGPTVSKNDERNGLVYLERPHYRSKTQKYVLGQISYWPVRVAYASTVHKSQSLTLDRCQIDFRGAFMGKPAMLYTSISRCRSAEGLRLVGDREMFAKRCQVDEKVRRWL